GGLGGRGGGGIGGGCSRRNWGWGGKKSPCDSSCPRTISRCGSSRVWYSTRHSPSLMRLTSKPLTSAPIWGTPFSIFMPWLPSSLVSHAGRRSAACDVNKHTPLLLRLVNPLVQIPQDARGHAPDVVLAERHGVVL